MDPEIRESIMGHWFREKSVSERYGRINDAELVNAIDLMTFYGRIKFDADPKNHGLQVGHEMVYIQWFKDKQGKPKKEVVWPETGKTATAVLHTNQ